MSNDPKKPRPDPTPKPDRLPERRVDEDKKHRSDDPKPPADRSGAPFKKDHEPPKRPQSDR